LDTYRTGTLTSINVVIGLATDMRVGCVPVVMVVIPRQELRGMG
jgi:hypothetical protein